MVDAELALTRALVDEGLAPEWMSAVCDPLADASQLDLGAIAAEARDGGNPVIPFVKHLGGAAERVHAGASDHIHVGATSQDILDTAAMVLARQVTGELILQFDSLGATLADLAAGTPRHRDERPHPRPAGLRSWARCTSLRGRSKDDRGISRLAVFLIF